MSNDLLTDKGMSPKKLLTFRGETKSQAQWARELRIPYQTIAVRLKKGWPIERVLSKGQVGKRKKTNRFLTFRGKTKTQAEWCMLLDIKPTTISQRLARGWTVEKALSFGVNQRFFDDDPLRNIYVLKKQYKFQHQKDGKIFVRNFETLEEAQEFRDNYLSSL